MQTFFDLGGIMFIFGARAYAISAEDLATRDEIAFGQAWLKNTREGCTNE